MARWFLAAAMAGVLAFAAACGGGDDGDSGAEPSPDKPQTVTRAAGLDAEHQPHRHLRRAGQGLVQEAGIEVEILPYGDAAPDTIVANGQADIGVSFPPSVIFSRAAGPDLVSVAAVLQRNADELAVLDSSEHHPRPRTSTARRTPASACPTRSRRSRRS